MKKIFTTLCILLLLHGTIAAQSFNEHMQAISKEMLEVATAKEKITQSMTHNAEGVITYKVDVTALKDGKVESVSYEFNLADIDFNTIRAITDKDVINVQLLVARKQELIKKTSNEKWTYIKELQIPAKDIEHARKLVEVLKAGHPAAVVQVDNRLSLKTEADRMVWLGKNVKSTRLNSKTYEQKLVFNKQIPGRVQVNISEISNQKATETEYQFNLANINPNSILLDVKTDHIEISFSTKRDLKLIKETQLGMLKHYQKEMVIYSESIENSRDLIKVLKSLVEASENKITASTPIVSSVSEGISQLNKYINKVVVNTNTYDQNLKGDCIVELIQRETTPKSLLTEQFNFNLKDLLRNSILIKVSGENLLLEVKTKSGDELIKYKKDLEQKNYVKELTLHLSEVEDMFKAESVLNKIIELCEKQEKSFPKDAAGLKSNITKSVHKVADKKLEYAQSIIFGDKKNVTFKVSEVSNNKSNEKIFEFTLKDINPQQVSFKTDGSKVYVDFKTNYMEKIIKYYENGEIKAYQAGFRIYADNIEEARDLTDQFKLLLAIPQ